MSVAPFVPPMNGPSNAKAGGVLRPPTTFMLDGKQYVTVIGGRGVVVPLPAPAGAAKDHHVRAQLDAAR